MNNLQTQFDDWGFWLIKRLFTFFKLHHILDFSVIRDSDLGAHRHAYGTRLRKITFQASVLQWMMCSRLYFYFKGIFKEKVVHAPQTHTNAHAKTTPFLFFRPFDLLIFSLFPICFAPLFLYHSLCLFSKEERMERWREDGRVGECVCVFLCVCVGVCIWKFLQHSGSVVVIQGVIQGDNEKTDKSTLILMWLIPTSAPPSYHPQLLHPHRSLFFSHSPLFLSSLSPFSSNGSCPFLSPSLCPHPSSPRPPVCSFTWHSCTEREEYLWIIRKWDLSLISDFTAHSCSCMCACTSQSAKKQNNKKRDASRTSINRKR